MNDPPFDHDGRQLEKEMLEAAEHVEHVAHVEKDPLLIILWRLNHQDRALESIKSDLTSHIAQNEAIKDSVDELVAFWAGSKVAGRIMTWGIGILAAAGAAYASFKKDLFS